MRTSTCHECGAVYRVLSGGHCTLCHRTFSSDSSADAHRRGPYDGGRYCVDVMDDYNTKGKKVQWRLNRYSEWTNQPRRVFSE